MKSQDLKSKNQQREQQIEKDRTPLGTAVEVNREKKLTQPNRPST